jgi:formate hydrogenlyase subunit 3/multisubunit Na+/H+ antiporter MnhD subunit
LVALPVAAAVVTYLIRRWTLLAAAVATLTSAALAFLCLRLPLDRSAFVLGREVAFGRPVVVFGQTLQLEPAGQPWLAFLFGLGTVFFLLAWRISQGRSFFPFSLAILGLYALVVLIPVFSLAILVFAISVTLTVFIIQAGQLSSVRGAQRYLLVSILAIPLLLTASWLVQPSAPVLNGPGLAGRALVPAILGFGLLLAAFPFGTWMPAVAADAPPVVAAFIFTTGQALALFLALTFASSNPDLAGDPAVVEVIRYAGLVMAVSGGLIAAAQYDFGRLLGYAALGDLGVLILALASGANQNLILTLSHLVSRSVSIALMAAALAVLRHWARGDQFATLGGAARRLPFAALGLVLGGLGLAGFPLTAGFPTHWAVYRAVSGGEPLWMLLLVLSSAGIVVGSLRGLRAMLGSEPRQDIAGQPIISSVMVLALAALSIVLGLYPQLLLGPVEMAAQAFSLF